MATSARLETQQATVLITRPTAQAKHFAGQCKALGFNVSLLPCIDIQACDLPVNELMLELQAHRKVLFTSANAVHAAHTLVPFPWKAHSVYAIGGATADVLRSYTQALCIEPVAPYNSESCLEQLCQQEPDRLLIAKGEGGRKLLADTLVEKHWQISTIDLYQRTLPDLSYQQIASAIAENKPDIVCVSSNEILSNLCRLAGAHLNVLKQCPIITNSQRCLELARSLGFINEIFVATPAGDQGQLKCLNDWRKSIERDR